MGWFNTMFGKNTEVVVGVLNEEGLVVKPKYSSHVTDCDKVDGVIYGINLSKKFSDYKRSTTEDSDEEVFEGEETSEDDYQYWKRDRESRNSFNTFFSFFGRGWGRKPYNDNGREYNSVSGNWEYVGNANSGINPSACDYEAPQDYQGSVPTWDGYNGE